MIYRDHKNKKTITIDFREVAPESASTTMYQNPSDKKYVSTRESGYKGATLKIKLNVRFWIWPLFTLVLGLCFKSYKAFFKRGIFLNF